MITEFGKIMRKYRIDHDMIMKDMATKIDVSISKLSSTESGRCKLTEEYVYKVLDTFSFTEDEIRQVLACLPKERPVEHETMSVAKGKVYRCTSWNIRVEEGERVVVTKVSTDADIVEFKVLSNGQCWGMGLHIFESYFTEAS